MDKILSKLSSLYREYADFTSEGMNKALKVEKVIIHYIFIKYKILLK